MIYFGSKIYHVILKVMKKTHTSSLVKPINRWLMGFTWFLILFSSCLQPTKLEAKDNILYIKCIDKQGSIALFKNNFAIQYKRKVLKNLSLFIEFSSNSETLRDIETKKDLNIKNDGVSIGVSLPSEINLIPSLGYKSYAIWYPETENRRIEPKTAFFTQLEYKLDFEIDNTLSFFFRLSVEEIFSESNTSLDFDYGILYGYRF